MYDMQEVEVVGFGYVRNEGATSYEDGDFHEVKIAPAHVRDLRRVT
jgi:hypothetical protein